MHADDVNTCAQCNECEVETRYTVETQFVTTASAYSPSLRVAWASYTDSQQNTPHTDVVWEFGIWNRKKSVERAFWLHMIFHICNFCGSMQHPTRSQHQHGYLVGTYQCVHTAQHTTATASAQDNFHKEETVYRDSGNIHTQIESARVSQTIGETRKIKMLYGIMLFPFIFTIFFFSLHSFLFRFNT